MKNTKSAGVRSKPEQSEERVRVSPPSVAMPLPTKVINISELRMSLAEFSKEGIREISLHDFLIYLAGLLKEKE